MSRFIIFGGDGFVGRYLAKELAKQGQQVLVCDMAQTADIYAACEFQQVDITQPEELRRLSMSSEDIVVHLAARQYHLPVPREGGDIRSILSQAQGPHHL